MRTENVISGIEAICAPLPEPRKLRDKLIAGLKRRDEQLRRDLLLLASETYDEGIAERLREIAAHV